MLDSAGSTLVEWGRQQQQHDCDGNNDYHDDGDDYHDGDNDYHDGDNDYHYGDNYYHYGDIDDCEGDNDNDVLLFSVVLHHC